ncbi:MAG: butyrate kinase [Firmicutes bacterium]|nr:butyrate kinase [Bacillota bacterium]
MKKTDILVINPGSTTTKIGMFRDLEPLFEETVTHDPDKLLAYGSIGAQLPYRSQLIKEFLAEKNYDMNCLKAVVGRGGMVIGLKGGGYRVNEALCEAMKSPDNPQHASSLGALISYDIAEQLGIPSFIYDSTMGCELSNVAKVSGFAELERYGCYHVLNSRAQAMNYAQSIGKKYEDLNLVVCHMGGGISASAHKDGRIIDGVSYDDGPMSPERTGGIPLLLWTNLCFSGKYTKEELDKIICGKGGLYSYLGVTDCREVEKLIDAGDSRAAEVYEAMAYQVAKGIAQTAVALKGKVDAVILTGGAAHSRRLTGMIKDYAGFIGEFVVMPGEDELLALAKGADRIMEGKETANVYGEK